jgi:ribosomal protein S18 acetylase RimI-like enzyme
MITLQPMTENDADIVLTIRNDEKTRHYLHNSDIFSIENFTDWINSAKPEWYIILKSEFACPWPAVKYEAVGYVRTSIVDDITYVGVDIDPYHRRLGYATQAYAQIFDMLIDRGEKEVGLAVLEDNIPAIKLYKKLGFYVKEKCLVSNKPSLAMRLDLLK